VVIEDDVWIGIGAIILKGVLVGRGARVGAGAIVTSDVPPEATVVGNPARVVSESAPPDD
jgi:acetyltransferase-like isoleucine patch superfamily enzyme